MSFFFSFGVVEIKANFLNFLNCCYRNLGQWSATTSNGIAFSFIKFEGFWTHSNPSLNKLRINSSLILKQFSLKLNFVVWIIQINIFIIWRKFYFFLNSRSPTSSYLSFQIQLIIMSDVFCLIAHHPVLRSSICSFPKRICF